MNIGLLYFFTAYERQLFYVFGDFSLLELVP